MYHYSAGKDRTGIITMLLLSVISMEDIYYANEYALSNEVVSGLRDLAIQHLMKKLDIEHPTAERITQYRADIILNTITRPKKDYGSVYEPSISSAEPRGTSDFT